MSRSSRRFGKILQCLCSGGEQSRTANEMIPSSESVATNGSSSQVVSSQVVGEHDKKPDTGSIEEAELSLRESGSINYEEARALLGRYEYQKGNIEAALHVFEGIDISSVTPKIKISLAKTGETRKRRSHNYTSPPLSAHALSLLLEAIYLKSKSLQILGRYKEAAKSCKVILNIVESSFPEGLPENFGADGKLQETLNNAVELLPELWQLAESPQEAISSFRGALLRNWNLNEKTTAKIEKDFAVFLLYSGSKEAAPPNLRSQMDTSFVPRNNVEEAILLLMILLKKVHLKKIEWDPSVIDHLIYALSICNGLGPLSKQLEELLPSVIDKKERDCVSALLMASKICGETPDFVEEGALLAKRVVNVSENKCDEIAGVAYSLLGISLSGQSKMGLTDSERVKLQSEAIQSLETANRLTEMKDSRIVYDLCLEYADQRKLDSALGQAKHLIKLESGSRIESWLLLTRILSGQKRFLDGEVIINAALEQTGKWDQGELLRTKAKLQIAQGRLKNAIETYTQLLAVLQVQNKSFPTQKKNLEVGGKHYRNLEVETWHDLAMVYISLSQWRDVEACLSRSEAINYHSSSRWRINGLLYEAKGLDKEALKAYEIALDIDPGHVQSLVSMAMVLRRLGGRSGPAIRSFLSEALRLDRMNSWAWYNLGQFYKDEGPMFIKEAVDCFEAASILKETEPIEPFR
ncbi:putative tetratricopeptide-like helical domain superfamily, protein NPG1 [Helianthus annuus]|nr:putative tetratricopeptide-like helical domain superfamily, protein NPG1 [Helianthus annuus]